MKHQKLTNTGKLKEEFLPAMYFDSSVLIDYWIVEGLHFPESHHPKNTDDNDDILSLDVIMRSNKYQKMLRIRERIINKKAEVKSVLSPLSLLELMEWKTETVFRELITSDVRLPFMQKKNKKEIGKYLKETMKLAIDYWEKGKPVSATISQMIRVLTTDELFKEVPELEEFLIVDILNFDLTISQVWKGPSIFSFLQLGAADILHILFAKHLGCKYIASFDSDFARVKDIVAEEFQMTILTNPDEVLLNL
jgi:hypothetical protein